MIRTLLFYYAFFRNHFVHALAYCSDFPQIKNPYMYYACYRLGMYRTVANTPFYTGRNWRGGFARAVSLSACGYREKAKQQIEFCLEKGFSDELKSRLAGCLAPFCPELAYPILKNISVPVSLRAALCLRVGHNEQALDMLSNYLTAKSDTVCTENYLYYCNAIQLQTQTEKLDYLNRFLQANEVPGLRLIDNSKPPSPMNVQVTKKYSIAGGPLVSILMTSYNSAEWIATAICSILDQSYRDLELIVVDDSSSDNTAQIVQVIADKDQRVKCIRLPRNVGTFVAKNIGLRYTNGEFVTCHDSDDWSHPLKVARQITPLLYDKRLVFTTSNWLRMQDDGLYYARPVHPLMRINPASPLFRRKLVLDHAGLWDPVRTGADSEFLARLKLVFGRKAMHRVAQPLTIGSHRQNSLMTAKKTGYSGEGMSPIRLAYWEAWNHWHISELRAKRKPMLKSFPNHRRQFEAPFGIRVPYSDIQACIKGVKIYEP